MYRHHRYCTCKMRPGDVIDPSAGCCSRFLHSTVRTTNDAELVGHNPTSIDKTSMRPDMRRMYILSGLYSAFFFTDNIYRERLLGNS